MSDDALKDFIQKSESENKSATTPEGPLRNTSVRVSNLNNDDNNLEYLELPVEQLPMGKFYRPGTKIVIRAAKVKEIQAYSMVDNKNIYDVTTKMNNILSSCAKVVYQDGSTGTYREIFEGDKLYLICELSRISMKGGRVITKDEECPNPTHGESLKIEMVKEHFVLMTPDEEIEQFYDVNVSALVFPLTTGQTIVMRPPTIGIQQDIYTYIMDRIMRGKEPNQSFMKCYPWVCDKESISVKECENAEFEYEKMDDDSFDFINDVVDRMSTSYGIKELKKKCKCGTEVHTSFTFPDGASSLFVVPGGFNRLIKK